MSKNWFVYMIETKCGALYTGITTDVERRYAEHLAVKEGGALAQSTFEVENQNVSCLWSRLTIEARHQSGSMRSKPWQESKSWL